MQENLSKSNDLEISILHNISVAIASNMDTSRTNHSSLSSSINNQKSFIQVISSIFTIVVGGPICYIIKKYKNGEINFDEILETLDKEESRMNNYSNLLTFASLLNNHNKQMEKQWLEVESLIDVLQASIIDLRNKLETTDTKSLKESPSQINDIEIKLLEIKILVKQLPNYHEFIVSLTDNLISTKK